MQGKKLLLGKGLLKASLGLALLVLAACNGTAVVTLTSTASTDNFLAYRVGLTSIQLQTIDGKSSLKVLPAGTTVDLMNLVNLSEVIGASAVAKGTYTSALITLDYSAAQIIYDNGSLDGVALTPMGANGQAAAQISVTATLDPANPFRITAKQSARLALDFKLAASNLVNLTNNTVTVTPLIGVSSMSIDTKAVRIRGPISAVNSTNLVYRSGVQPFDGSVNGAGTLAIVQNDVTTYEINGAASTGTAGLTQLAGLGGGTLAVAYGNLTESATTSTSTITTPATVTTPATTTTPGTTVATPGTETISTSSTNIAFTATQVLAGSSVQGGGFDRISGVVSARSGNTLTLEDATLVGNNASNTFIPGTTVINLGPNTVITEFGAGTADILTTAQISVGSTIDAFGTATTTTSGTATLDASAGRVRIDVTNASGIVSSSASGTLLLDLGTLGGRAIAAFDFVGTGADPTQYSVTTTNLDLANAIAGSPVTVSGIPSAFGTTTPDFTATGLLDTTTIVAQIVIDWAGGTAAPFVTFDTTQIDLNIHNSGVGQRHEIQVASQTTDLASLPSDPLIAPNVSGSTALFAIGHSVSATVENFDSYAAFITQLQAELNGTVLATNMTAAGQWTASTSAFSATSITLFLNN